LTAAGLNQFVHGGRLAMTFEGKTLVRAVHRAEIVRAGDTSVLEEYMAERVPYFYKSPHDIAKLFEGPYFLDAIRKVLLKLPSAENFRESHFGEILAGVYGEEVLGLRMLYSKLAVLTAENANAYKMDVLFYRPGQDPAEFVFAEVKSSVKTADHGLPAGHDKSCFASLFDSFNKYTASDVEFDLAAVQERLDTLPLPDREVIRQSLLPHRARSIQFAGFCVIDRSTHNESESAVLATRKNDRTFDVDLLCVAELPDVIGATYDLLEAVKP
jgi:hypothetical protein